MVIDGRKIADEIIDSLGDELRGRRLAVIAQAGNAATESYVAIKARVAGRLGVEMIRFSPEQLTEALACDAVLVQLPIDNAETLLASLPAIKDVDALGEHAVVLAPVAGAISEILARAGVAAKGKRAVVVGAGKLVGVPAAGLLQELGAEVEVVTKNEGTLLSLKEADIVVLGAGDPGMVTPQMLKEGVVLLDAGTSEAGGRVVGDAAPECAHVASVFTPVPGGIGPIAVAMLFKNLHVLVRENNA